jgi:hypothetical protein
MLIPNFEAMLCVVTLLLGSAGLYVLFLFTDADAKRWSADQVERAKKHGHDK